MSSRDLLRDPCWQGSDLGHPLPDATHAVSVALPRWSDVIAYEEQDPACRGALRAVYPRFGQHPLVAQVAKLSLQASNLASSKGASSWPYPNRTAAEAALAHCRRTRPPAETQLSTIHGLTCLIADSGSTPAAKAFWQHTGFGASSRLAAITLGQEQGARASAAKNARSNVIRRLERIYRCEGGLISLHPSGMSALHRALQLISAIRPNRPVLQIGFPYVDVLKLPQVVFNGAELLLDDRAASVSVPSSACSPRQWWWSCPAIPCCAASICQPSPDLLTGRASR